MPYVACELFCSELPSILAQFFQPGHEALPTAFLDFVKRESINPVLGGYFERIFQMLVGL